jgi:hypothetical protein
MISVCLYVSLLAQAGPVVIGISLLSPVLMQLTNDISGSAISQ